MSRTPIMLIGAIAFGASELAIEIHPEVELPLRDNPSRRPTQLLLGVEGVSIHHAGAGWIDLNTRGIFDLLDDTAEWPLLDGRTRVPDGTYDKIRFEVQFASVKVDRKWYDLEIPSADSSGLKIDAEFCLLDGQIDVLTLRWDIDKLRQYSAHKGYWMNPVINAWTPPTCTDDLRTPPVDHSAQLAPQRQPIPTD